MFRKIIRNIIVGAGSLAVSVAGMSGVAAANSASISNTGPDSVNVIGGGRGFSSASIHTTGPDSRNVIRSGSQWNKWEPNNWQHMSFEDWWGKVNKWVDSHQHDKSWSDRNCDRKDWTPAHTSKWSSWNPADCGTAAGNGEGCGAGVRYDGD